VLLDRDLALRREAGADEGRAQGVPEARRRQEQEVVRIAPVDDERSDHPGLRRQEQCVTRVAGIEPLHVVRDHRLEVGRGVRASHAHEVARKGGFGDRIHRRLV